MLIKFENLIRDYGISVSGILHVGAHNCEELGDYTANGVPADNIYWVEAMREKVDKMRADKPGVKIYHAVVSNEDGKAVTFNVANNGQSSSMLEFGSHAKTYPGIRYVKQLEMTTTRLATLVEREGIPMKTINFMNLDIQGVELDALKSMDNMIDHVDYIYTEINTQQVYKGCCEVGELDEFLSSKGFDRVATRVERGAGWGDAFYVRRKVE
jgi:FkbM family methyltransferase